jgi:hypothetical protein
MAWWYWQIAGELPIVGDDKQNQIVFPARRAVGHAGAGAEGRSGRPVDDDMVGRARERPAALRVRPHCSVE